jgi:hypothetical protein
LNPPGADEAELKTRTLTKLYNARPTWLRMAHDMLDDAVLDAYGWPHNLIDTELLELLFVLNRERAAAEVAFVGQLLLPDPAVVTKDRFERARRAPSDRQTGVAGARRGPRTRHRRPA